MIAARASSVAIALIVSFTSLLLAQSDSADGQLRILHDENGKVTVAIAVSDESRRNGEIKQDTRRSIRFVLETNSTTNNLTEIVSLFLGYKDNLLGIPLNLPSPWVVRQGILQDGGRSFVWNSKSNRWDETVILNQNASMFIDRNNLLLDQNPYFKNKVNSLNSRIKLAQSGIDSDALPSMIGDKQRLDHLVATGGTLAWDITEQDERGSLTIKALADGKIGEIKKELGGTSTLILNFSVEMSTIQFDDSFLLGKTLMDLLGTQINIEDNGFIGIEINLPVQDDKIIVSKVIPGSPAKEAGIQSGDELVSINNISLADKDPRLLRDLMKGNKSVVLEIFRPTTSAIMVFEIDKQLALRKGD